MITNLIAITVFGLLWGSLILIAYKTGVKDGREIAKGVSPTGTPIFEMFDNFKREKKPNTERDKYNKILENIDNYDGTRAGQKEV